MKASELIEALQSEIALYGDVPVVIYETGVEFRGGCTPSGLHEIGCVSTLDRDTRRFIELETHPCVIA